jgi:hypothetical protein
VVGVALAALVAAGCGADPSDADKDGGGSGSGKAIATFEVAGGETFKVELATPELVDQARKMLTGEERQSIPLSTVVRGDPGVNAPWTWHLDPAQFQFAFATIEVCDGIPSDVEKQLITSDSYCPWSAKTIAVTPEP